LVPKARGSPDGWPLAPAETWLMKSGWKRWGGLDPDESPRLRGAAGRRVAAYRASLLVDER